jgi:ATP-dependent DNA ligase
MQMRQALASRGGSLPQVQSQESIPVEAGGGNCDVRRRVDRNDRAEDCHGRQGQAKSLTDGLAAALGPCRAPGLLHPALHPDQVTRVPEGLHWVHEIKHDVYRLLVRRQGARVRLSNANTEISRYGRDPSERVVTIVGMRNELL